MRYTSFAQWLLPALVLTLICSFSFMAAAQNYYPPDVGNTWVLTSTDGAEQRIYSVEEPDIDGVEGLVLLKIVTKLRSGDIVEIDNYYLVANEDGLHLHKLATDEGAFGIATATFSPPIDFFPSVLPIGRTWDIVLETELQIVGTTNSTTNITVLDIETVKTPAGTFENCAKIELKRKSVTSALVVRGTSYTWLAPNLGPVKFQNEQDVVYELTEYNLVEGAPEPEKPVVTKEPETETPVATDTPKVEPPVQVDSYSFTLSLNMGLNMISVPLMPAEPYTAKSLAKMLGATVIVKLDAVTKHFVAYSVAEAEDGFAISGNMGYIVNIPTAGTVTFAGSAWANPDAAATADTDAVATAATDAAATANPDVAAAPAMSSPKSAWAFVVTSNLQGMEAGTSYTVVAENLRTGVIAIGKVNNGAKAASAAWADLNRKRVVETGDKLEIAVYDEYGNIVSGPFQRTVSTADIHSAYLSIQLRIGDVMPKATVLAQNFPNPFNPETWMPYQLNKATEVAIQIYDISGRLVRTLELGWQKRGAYMTASSAAYWDGKNEAGEPVASGTYFYTLRAQDFAATRKMVILK